ncbi:MAG: PQQ-binding-like beta-propeller repeat protein [Alphaproteobacteria bacterium]|nr:PQQ-binding-like beta-propeller repeat protein [Rhodospirillales bacterium]MCW9046261.1 PQQ-binding-like beta-propeller repeat protein [Alphaproteobacteria bacterium]
MRSALIPLAIAATLISGTAIAKPVIYVAAGSANKILAIDPETNKVIQEIDGVENPHALATTPDGEYVISGSLKEKMVEGRTESAIYVVHPVHGHVMSTIKVDGMIHHQTITPDGNQVISTHPTKGTISTANLDTGKVKTLKTGPGPNYTIISEDGQTAFVSNTGNGTISEIDLADWKVVRQIESGPGAEHLAISGDEKTLFAINARAGTISEISIDSGNVAKTYEVGKSAHGLDISEDGKQIFATSKKGDLLVATELATGKQRKLSLSPAPYHLEVIKGTGKIYISSRKRPKIWVVDQQTLKLENEISIVGEGHQMALGEQ